MNELIHQDHLPATQAPSGLAEQTRAAAEIQAALTIAASRPRDEKRAVDRILNACQRPRLAENSQYDFSRGGTAITGANVRLLEVIASCWGNLQYGFRELEQRDGQSHVEAFAWDLETNTRVTRVFAIPHKTKAYGELKTLTDPTDIYYHVANQAQRRVRAALEEVIPRDVVEDAIDECAKTLKASVDITPASLKKLVATFGKFKVTKAQIEKRIQRQLDAITAAQYVKLQRIYTSMRDGMSEAGDWFDPIADAVESHKQQVNAKRKADPEPGHDLPIENQTPPPIPLEEYIQQISETDNLVALREIERNARAALVLDDAMDAALCDACDGAEMRIKESAK